jgi:hypothetical protein
VGVEMMIEVKALKGEAVIIRGGKIKGKITRTRRRRKRWRLNSSHCTNDSREMMMQLLHFVKCSRGGLPTKMNLHLCLRPRLGRTLVAPLRRRRMPQPMSSEVGIIGPILKRLWDGID